MTVAPLGARAIVIPFLRSIDAPEGEITIPSAKSPVTAATAPVTEAATPCEMMLGKSEGTSDPA